MVICSAFPLGLADSNTDATGVLTGAGAAEFGTAGVGTVGSAVHRRIKVHDMLIVCRILYSYIFVYIFKIILFVYEYLH